MPLIFLLAVLLTGCRYTFLPLVPERAEFPDRPRVSGSLLESGNEVLAKLVVRSLSKPGYLELKWYQEEVLLTEKSVWVEGPGGLEARFSRPNDGYYRLLVLSEGSVLLQLDLGAPNLPSPPGAATAAGG